MIVFVLYRYGVRRHGREISVSIGLVKLIVGISRFSLEGSRASGKCKPCRSCSHFNIGIILQNVLDHIRLSRFTSPGCKDIHILLDRHIQRVECLFHTVLKVKPSLKNQFNTFVGVRGRFNGAHNVAMNDVFNMIKDQIPVACLTFQVLLHVIESQEERNVMLRGDPLCIQRQVVCGHSCILKAEFTSGQALRGRIPPAKHVGVRLQL